MTQSKQQSGGNPATTNEFEDYIGYVILGGIAIVAFIILIQYTAFIARYIYAPFAMPVWIMGQKAGTIGSLLVILFYAIICVAIQLLRTFVLKKEGYLWASLSVLFLFIASLEFITGSSNSLLTSHVNSFCNPETVGLSSIFTCQYGLNEIRAAGTSNVIIMSFIPNVVLAWPLFYELVAGFLRTTNEHPFALTKKVHNVDSFIKEQKVQYSHLKYYDIINPNTLPDNEGPLRLMDDSRRFVYQNDLIANFTVRPDLADSSNFGKQFGQTPVPPDLSYYDFKQNDMVPVLDATKFERLMNEQLGEPWAGVENLAAAEVIVMSIALPRACCLDESITTKEADAVKDDCDIRIEKVWDWAAQELLKPASEDSAGLEGFPDLEYYRSIIEKWLEHRIAKDIIKEHAYVRTILYRALEDSKKIGVMQPSKFRYLKEYDRAVWALVQNVNRPSAFAENIAVVAHFKEERQAGVAINKPGFQSAYNGLVERIREFRYTKKHVEAWHKWKTEGNPIDMINMGMVSAVDTEFVKEDDIEEIEEAEYTETK